MTATETPAQTEARTCEFKGCGNQARPRPVYDANPVPALRAQIGTTAICDPCQARTDAINARVRATR